MENDNNSIIYIVIFSIIIFLFVVAIIYITFFDNDNDKNSIKKDEYYVLDKVLKNKKDKTINIDDMITVVSKDNLRKNDLFLALQYYINNFEIPKEDELELNKYMLFVFLVSSHRSADAKLIAYMSITLRKLYPHHSARIEIEEQKGIEYRKKRYNLGNL